MDIENHQEYTYQPNESEFQKLFKSARELVFALSLDGQIVEANSAFEKLTGWKANEWTGKKLENLLHPADVPGFRDRLKQANEGEETTPFDTRLRSADGKELELESSLFPIDRNEGTARILMFSRDISSRKRKEENLFESD